MANDLSDIVEIFITRETAAIDTAAFNVPLLLATFTNFSERTRTYTSFTGVAEDFNSTDNIYKMAQAIFSGDIFPPSIVVGRRQIDEVTITPTVANNATYTVTINDTAYSFVSDGTATAAEITAGLDTAIGSPTGITVTDGVGSLTVEVSTPGTAWSISVSSNLVKTDVASTESWADALDAVQEVNDDWYALTAETRVEADILALAASIEAQRKIYITVTADPVAVTTGTTDIAYQLAALNYDRTGIVYLTSAATQFPECVWVGSQLPEVPGSNTWNLKQGSGITVDVLSETKKVNLRDKKANFYTRRAGVEIFQDGIMASGEFIDVMIFVDWLYARLQEAIFFRLINSKKIPYTRRGAAIIENEIRTVLSQGVANGGIADDTPYVVISPDPLNISPTLRAQRTMGDFTFTARLAGAVHKVIVRGTVGV